ncbi:MAG: UDP-3-O-(3-hydroxymyristoyl)glucosamine N-acyltransferase [Phycisphaera sp.]|nr:UDP-3-O-(3-hydroxymyristoyl)glucosamine N-acyltransferase [Phycisphaera sp.]
MSMTLQQLADRIGATIRSADADAAQRTVTACSSLEAAGPDDVAFLANVKYTSQVQTTRAAAVIVAPDITAESQTLLVADDPYFAFRNAMVELHGFRNHPAPSPDGKPVSPLAVVSPTAKVGHGTKVHPFAVISDHAVVGENCVIYPGVFVGPRARVGNDCQLYPNVVVYDDCVLGNRVTLHSGCVIGQDGFGYATHGEPGQAPLHHKIPQAGNAVIEDDVEMGAGCTIDRATMGSTVIGVGTKFSDLIAIGHGTKVGPHNLYVAQVGLAGSVTTGAYVVMGGQAGVAGHLKIGNQVKVAAKSGIMHEIPDKTDVGGQPALPLNEGKRLLLSSFKVPDLLKQVKQMQRDIDKLKAQLETGADASSD